MESGNLHPVAMSQASKKCNVGLFVTCLVDLFRPSVGFAAVKLLEDSGCIVSVPRAQTCCGQPAHNSGDKKNAKALAQQTIAALEGFDYVVAPSGSCAGMIKKHYPTLFSDTDPWKKRAEDLAARTYELISFLSDILKVKKVKAQLEATATYHDSCSSLRELGIKHQPRKLLKSVKGLTIKEASQAEACCGFGGTFSIKYPDISNAIVTTKTNDLEKTEADIVLGGDLGCLMNIAGKLKRQNSKLQVRHVAEVLAGMTDKPAIGEGEDG